LFRQRSRASTSRSIASTAEEVIAFTEARNDRSRAVMVRLGMSYSHEMVDNEEPFVLYRISSQR
jgi:RimJ/RimL family protein N-acetyltransferase